MVVEQGKGLGGEWRGVWGGATIAGENGGVSGVYGTHLI